MGELAEQYLYSDTNTCFLKMGLLAEHIVEYMLAYDGIPQPEYDNTHANRINLLRRNDLLPREIDNILYVLRKQEMMQHIMVWNHLTKQKIIWNLHMIWHLGSCRHMEIIVMSQKLMLCQRM